ncbi:hypothetical protein V4F30_22235 [Rhodococcus sp. IITD102]|uniref:hypothetical protein n=1 Tax=Rhodococcus TaxID=1827 RepID=UPI0026F44474|nr:hypothetical protein [Rhodococcus ruber]MDO2379819.1 hypothetical protein [Rhodococcus ruber]
MTTGWVGVIGALMGAIVGALLTQHLQRRNAAHARLHESRIEAYRKFIAAMMEFRKTLTDRWHVESDNPAQEVDSAQVYAARSAAWAAYYDVELLARDLDLIALALDARDRTAAIKNATDRSGLNTQTDLSRTAIGKFAQAAREEVTSQ